MALPAKPEIGTPHGHNARTVSVVIPVFNVEDFIRECLDSLLAQSHADFEAILVDDGSTDSSGAICDEYSSKDSRIIVMHTGNEGIGAARNLGLEVASGTYCFFLDPDDVIGPSTFADMVDLIEAQHADIVLGASQNFRGSFASAHKEYGPRSLGEATTEIHSSSSAILERLVFQKKDFVPLRDKSKPEPLHFEFFSSLYRLEMIRANSIAFLPLTYGEDTYVLLNYLLLSEKAVATDLITYWHRRNPKSTTFRYHPEYLLETHRYYAFYSQLFVRLAPPHFARALAALDGQFFMRCVSAVERELFFSPDSRTLSQIKETFREIRNDAKFRGLLRPGMIGLIASRQSRILITLLYLKQYWALIMAVALRRHLRRNGHRSPR